MTERPGLADAARNAVELEERMTHPTDDELEAMAVRLVKNAEYRHHHEAAAMLRACKGRVRVKLLEWSEGYRPVASQQPYQIWQDNGGSGAPDDPIENFDGFMTYDPQMMALGVHPTTEAAKAAAQADYEARILSALETAPASSCPLGDGCDLKKGQDDE